LYNLGGGRENAVRLSDLVGKLEEVSGLQAIVDEQNPAPAPVPLNYISDLTVLHQELGWKPQITLENGLRSLFGS
jgi:nucleoside-diphosphate-sugar epimerase